MKEIQKKSKQRLCLLDEYRGFVVLNMVAYHAIWDLVYMFGVNWQWYKSDIGHVWQQWICWSFILLSGFCWQMGIHPLKRGLLVYGGGALISLVTICVMPSSRVVFGVLTLLGSCMILMIPMHLIAQKINPYLGAVISFGLFLFTYPVNRGYFGFGAQKIVELPDEWYANAFTTYLGFVEKGFFSTDYFALLPWLLLFITGYFLYGIVFAGKRENQVIGILQKSICKPLGWIGKNALLIYMLHQPLIYGVLYIWHTVF